MGEDVDLLLRWFEVSKAGLIGPELVHQYMEKVEVIQEILKIARVIRNPTVMIGGES